MENSSHISSSFQAYILEYVTGVLWILTLCAALPSARDVAGFMSAVGVVFRPATEFNIPDAVTGGLAAIAGIVIPYAVAIALMPVSIWLMNGWQTLWRWVEQRILRRPGRDLHLLTNDRLKALLGIGSRIGHAEELAYVASQNETLALRLEWIRNNVVFRAAATLPSALLFGVSVYRFLQAPGWVSIVAGAVVYGLGVAYAIGMLNEWRDRTDSVIVLYTNSQGSQ
jgi:hypothetical protein